MKKKIAIFAGGWGGEYLQEVLAGIVNSAYTNNSDIFAFINFSIASKDPYVNIAEVNFFKLPNINDFDAVILLANSFNCEAELDYLVQAIHSTNIPALSIEYELDGIPNIATNNYNGMHDLVTHIVVEHQAKNIVFIGGPKEHPESQIRLRALLDVAAENDITIPSDNILHGDWGKVIIPDLIDAWFNEHDNKLPDAFVCANDIMAIAVCDHLRSLGYSLPRDVIITGYDCIAQAQNFNPSITSVNHEWYTMGEQAFALITNLINGQKIKPRTLLGTKFVAGRTCGCETVRQEVSSKAKAKLGRALTDCIMDPISVDSHFRHFYHSVRKVNTKQELNNAFSYLFEGEHSIEGNSFSLYLDPEFFNVIEGDTNLRLDGRCDLYDCVCNLDNGKSTPIFQINLYDAIFAKASRSETPAYYLFIPLHSEQPTYGFAMLDGTFNAANENQYYIWSRHIIQALEQVRCNITISELYKKMRELSLSDPLTGVYNRSGCEAVSYPMLIDWQKQGGYSAIMLIDVDRMKIINDNYGHSCGDIALRLVARALKSSLPDNFIISRFGGDEFFAAGNLSSKDYDLKGLSEKVEATLCELCQSENIDFKLTISIGYECISPTCNSDIEKGINSADNNMYELKKLHHEES